MACLLLQCSALHSKGFKYYATFYDKIMKFCENHLINGKKMFLGTRIIENSLPTRVKRCDVKFSDVRHQVEMLGVEFSMLFEIKTRRQALFKW